METDEGLLNIAEPIDYWSGIGGDAALPIPRRILFFVRRTREDLQQQSLRHRSHHRYVLAFNRAAAGTVHLDNHQLRLEPGRALLVLPYQFHHFSHLSSERIEWVFCTFEMGDGAFLEPFRDRVVAPRSGAIQAMKLLLTEWQRCHRPDGGGELQAMQLQIVLLYLLISLRDDLQVQSVDLPAEPQGRLLRRINRFMSESRGRPVGGAEIAAALGLSVSRLRALFRQSAGVPLGSYLLNYRLNRAMALLRNTTDPISEIAREAGFGSPQAFSRIFKQKVGQTPRGYRQL